MENVCGGAGMDRTASMGAPGRPCDNLELGGWEESGARGIIMQSVAAMSGERYLRRWNASPIPPCAKLRPVCRSWLGDHCWDAFAAAPWSSAVDSLSISRRLSPRPAARRLPDSRELSGEMAPHSDHRFHLESSFSFTDSSGGVGEYSAFQLP